MKEYIVRRTMPDNEVAYLELNFKWHKDISKATKLTEKELQKQKDNNFYITVGDIEFKDLKENSWYKWNRTIKRDDMTMNVEYHYQFDCCEDHEGSMFTNRKLKDGDNFMCEICGTVYTLKEDQ